MHYDIAEKVLIEKCRETILSYLMGIEVLRSTIVEELPQETVSVRRSDFSIRVQDAQGQTFIVLLELKSRWEKDAGLQVLEYRVRYKTKYALPVFSCIVLLTPSDAATSCYVDEEVHFSYRLIKIYELDASTIISEGLTCLMPFVPLMQNGKSHIRQAEDGIYNSDMNRKDKADMMTSMAILSGLVSREIPQEIFSRRRDLMIESVAYDILREDALREGLREGLQEGRQKGLQEGLQKGLQEGRQKGLQEGLQKGLQEGLQEGLQKGLREGFEKGIQKSIRKMFLKGFKPQEIADVLDVDIQEVLAVIQFDSDEKP